VAPEKDEKIVRPTRRVAAVVGFLLKAEVDAIFQQQPFETIDGLIPSGYGANLIIAARNSSPLLHVRSNLCQHR
jgi:hypothetical protein